MTIEFRQEDFTKIYKEADSMFNKHFLELKMSGEFNLHVKGYEALEDRGWLKFYTARLEGELVGYCSMVLNKDGHSGQLAAKQDSLYIKPALRNEGVGRKFIAYIESQLVNLGIQKLSRSVPVGMDWSKLLISNGYKEAETTYIKEI